MQVNVNNYSRMICIWLTSGEDSDAVVRESLLTTIEEYHAKGFQVAVFVSGQGNLYSNTLALLKHNRFVPELETVEIE